VSSNWKAKLLKIDKISHFRDLLLKQYFNIKNLSIYHHLSIIVVISKWIMLKLFVVRKFIANEIFQWSSFEYKVLDFSLHISFLPEAAISGWLNFPLQHGWGSTFIIILLCIIIIIIISIVNSMAVMENHWM